MAKQQLSNLIGELHDHFAYEDTSPQQERLLRELEQHIHKVDEPAPIDPSLSDTAKQLVQELDQSHPKAAGIIKQILTTLEGMGI